MVERALSIKLGADPAGISGRLAEAFGRFSNVELVSVITRSNYIRYPGAATFKPHRTSQLWRDADVVHLHDDGFAAVDYMQRRKRVPDRPLVMHFHNSGFRANPEPYLAECERRGALPIVSTLDLRNGRDLAWLPAPFDVPTLEAMRAPGDPDRIRIMHSPTSRAVKGTDEFLDACRRLQNDGYPVDVLLAERITWAESLAMRATADIVFDQVPIGYGCSAIEGMAMGIPVVAGGSKQTLTEIRREVGIVPYHHTEPGQIYDALRRLVADPGYRVELGARGREYAGRYHDYPAVVERATAIYEAAAA